MHDIHPFFGLPSPLPYHAFAFFTILLSSHPFLLNRLRLYHTKLIHPLFEQQRGPTVTLDLICRWVDEELHRFILPERSTEILLGLYTLWPCES
jgi:hypothetical protein